MSINQDTIETIFINSKSNLKNIKLKKELCFLFLSNAFAKMYLDGTDKPYPTVEHLAFIELGKKSKVYGKQINNILEDSFKAFDFIEKQELKNRSVEKSKKDILKDDNNSLAHTVDTNKKVNIKNKKIVKKNQHLMYGKTYDYGGAKGTPYYLYKQMKIFKNLKTVY